MEIAPPRSEEITHPTLVAIYRYWEGKRRDRAMPARSDMEPTELGALLPYIYMVDVERAPLRFKYRLIGTAIVHLLGRDYTGRTVDAQNYGAQHAAELQAIFSIVIESARPVGWKGTMFYIAGREWLPIESILLPLAKDGHTVDIIFAAFVPVRAGTHAAATKPAKPGQSRLIPDPVIAAPES